MAENNRRAHFRRYAVYLLVATAVGLITVGIREIVGYGLGRDTPFHYGVSVLIAYACGVALNFLWQERFTFAHPPHPRTRGRFTLFAVIAVASALLTVILSRVLRYTADFDTIFGAFGAAIAFACAALLASVFSFSTNSKYVFPQQAR